MANKQYSYEIVHERPGWPVETVFRKPNGETLFCIEVTKIAAQSIVDELNRLLIFKGDLIERLIHLPRIADQVDLAMEWVEQHFAGKEIEPVDRLLYQLGSQPELISLRAQCAVYRTSFRAKDMLPHWQIAVDRAHAYAQKMAPDEVKLFRGLL